MNHPLEIQNFSEGIPCYMQIVSIEQLELHWHNYIEIFFVLSGRIQMLTNNISFFLDEGHICFLGAGTIHSVSRTNCDNLVLILQIDAEYHGFPQELGYMRFDHQKYLHDLQCKTLPLVQLQQILAMLYLEYEHRAAGGYCHILSLLHLLLGRLLRSGYLVPKAAADEVSDTNLNRLHKVLNDIHMHYTDKITLHELAEKLHMNYYYLSRLFRQTTGISFQEYITNLRLDKSLSLLAKPRYTVSRAAMECGFPTLKAFTHSFKSKYNMLPSEYRRQALARPHLAASAVTIPEKYLPVFAKADLDDEAWETTEILELYNGTDKDDIFRKRFLEIQFEAGQYAAQAVPKFQHRCLRIFSKQTPSFQQQADLWATVGKWVQAEVVFTSPEEERSVVHSKSGESVNKAFSSYEEEYTSIQACRLIKSVIARRQIPSELELYPLHVAELVPGKKAYNLFAAPNLPSPALLVLSLLTEPFDSCMPAGDFLLARQGSDYLFLAYNDREGTTVHLKLKLDFLTEAYAVQYFCIDASHGCLYDEWMALNGGQPLTEETAMILSRRLYPGYRERSWSDGKDIGQSIRMMPYGVVIVRFHLN